MTYNAFISALTTEIRESRAWPDNSSSDKLAEQLRIIYGAALALAKELPVRILHADLTEAELTEDEDYIYDLPATTFLLRPDLGIVWLKIGSNRYTAHDSSSLQAIRSGKASPFQKSNTLFHIDPDGLQVHLAGPCDGITVNHIPLPTEPTSGNYETLDLPVPAGQRDQLLQLVSMHVEAIQTGNRGKSAVHKALSELYGQPRRVSDDG